jgi:hypothetical protein
MRKGGFSMADADRTIQRNPETDYERRDLPLVAYAAAAIGIALLLGVAPIAIRIGYPAIRHDVERRLAIVPPAPRLQTKPPQDLAAYLAEQRALLDSYGWIDREKGIAREPIEAAMKQLVRDGSDGFPSEAARR